MPPLEPEALIEIARDAALTRLEERLGGPDLPGPGKPPEVRLIAHAPPRPREDGLVEVALDVLTFYSVARVTQDAETGDLLSWSIDRLRRAPETVGATHDVTDDDAIALAGRAAGGLPPGAHLAGIERTAFRPGEPLIRVRWQHLHEGIRVEGDYLEVQLNPLTGRASAVHRAWRAGPFPPPT
jgi:hypothetical protein